MYRYVFHYLTLLLLLTTHIESFIQIWQHVWSSGSVPLQSYRKSMESARISSLAILIGIKCLTLQYYCIMSKLGILSVTSQRTKIFNRHTFVLSSIVFIDATCTHCTQIWLFCGCFTTIKLFSHACCTINWLTVCLGCYFILYYWYIHVSTDW